MSAIGLGGWHLALKHVDEALSLRIVRTAIDRGITFMDNSWDYNDGASETRMGKALRDGYRRQVFLMTKIDGRSYAEAMRQLDTSLERLQTDCLDLVQHHEVIRYESLDQACEAARTFRPMSETELTALLSKTATAAAHGEFEPFKTSSIFDSTAQNPAWLGDEPQRLQNLLL